MGEGRLEDIANVLVFMEEGGHREDAKKIVEEMEKKLLSNGGDGWGEGGGTLESEFAEREEEDEEEDEEGEGDEEDEEDDTDKTSDEDDEEDIDLDMFDVDDEDDLSDMFASSFPSHSGSKTADILFHPSGKPKTTPITSILNALVKMGLMEEHSEIGGALWTAVKDVEREDNVEFLRGAMEK